MKKLVFVMSLLAIVVSGCGQDSSRENKSIHLEATSKEYTATVEMSPGKVGPNDYLVTITDDSKQVMHDGQAILHFSMEGMDHGNSQEELHPEADGKWHGRGPNIMMEGLWSVQLEWDQPDGQSHKKRFFDFSATIKE
ncbi:FixH family protein [Brevibacillus ginsengisoli]|uniref:FixH family protein n=1 Tax=Brevibacillus ginsengisoli TaxID=363854 RepID=UPI003CE91FC3